jgi:hypothetical protein
MENPERAVARATTDSQFDLRRANGGLAALAGGLPRRPTAG